MWKEYVRKAVASILAGAMLLAGVGGNVSASELDVEVLDTEVLVRICRTLNCSIANLLEYVPPTE